MGVMRFQVHPPRPPADWPEAVRGFVSGFDQSVYPCRVEFDGQLLTCRRQNSESGRFHVAWDIPGFGRPMVSTASLPERESPYLLPLELARGKIVQLRNQLAQWETAGLQKPAGFSEVYRDCHSLFARAVSAQSQPQIDTVVDFANQALVAAFQAAEILTQAYAQQSLAARQRRFTQIPTLLGCYLPQDLTSGDDWRTGYLTAFNSAAVPVEWRLIEPREGEYFWDACDAQIDWCQEHKLVAKGGPLLDLGPQGLPSWLVRWEQDIWNLTSFVCDFIETVIRRYQGRVRMWEVASRANTGGGLTLSEEHRLGLIAKALEVARHVDEEAQMFMRIDQPWAEYQARGQHKLSPLQFADALARAGLGLTGLNLELSMGYVPRGSASRDLLEYSRLIDFWSTLGMPLQITLAFPSASGVDPQCESDLEVERPSWKGAWTPETQADWLDQTLPLLLAKPAVIGVFWNQLSDAEPHRFPFAGLRDAGGVWKPGLQRIIDQRRTYLK